MAKSSTYVQQHSGEGEFSDGEVGLAVPVEIRHDCRFPCLSPWAVALSALESAVAVAQQDISVGEDQVRLAISIEVGYRQGVATCINQEACPKL